MYSVSFLVGLNLIPVGFGEGDRTMREDREDREAYRRGPMEGEMVVPCSVSCIIIGYCSLCPPPFMNEWCEILIIVP